MKVLEYEKIVNFVASLCREAAVFLDPKTEEMLRLAAEKASKPRSGEAAEGASCVLEEYVLKKLLENAEIAREKNVPLCQDTGTAVFFVEMGTEVSIEGGTIYDALEEGTAKGYREGYLRKSIVKDPLFDRSNTGDNTPSVVHLSLRPGEDLTLMVLLKGAGSENMGRTAMLTPGDGIEGVIDFVVQTVVAAGGNPCPPTVVGVGVGGNFELAPFLAKKALTRPLGEANFDPRYAELEGEILDRLNRSGIGPAGLGGGTTAFAVHIESAPCHIASLPVAVNLNCHAVRHGKVVL